MGAELCGCVATIELGQVKRVLIDMPVDLAFCRERRCDLEAQKLLGRRWICVFRANHFGDRAFPTW